MKTSRFLLYGYTKPFGLIILFTMGIVVGTNVSAVEPVSTEHPAVALSPTSMPHIAKAEPKKDVNSSSIPTPGKHSDVSSPSPIGPKPSGKLPSKISTRKSIVVATYNNTKRLQAPTGKSSNETSPIDSTRPQEQRIKVATAPPQDTLNNITSVADGSEDASSSEKNYITILLAVVSCVLGVVAITVFLYCRHRRHTGSTKSA